MKTFIEYLKETHSEYGFSGAGLSSSTVPYDIDNQEVKNKVNAILGHVAVSEFLNPAAAVAQMEAKLGQIGMMKKNSTEDMGRLVPEEFGTSGELDLQFSQMGETIGKSVDTPIDQLDKEEKIVSLKVRYEQLESGSYKVYGSLV